MSNVVAVGVAGRVQQGVTDECSVCAGAQLCQLWLLHLSRCRHAARGRQKFLHVFPRSSSCWLTYQQMEISVRSLWVTHAARQLQWQILPLFSHTESVYITLVIVVFLCKANSCIWVNCKLKNSCWGVGVVGCPDCWILLSFDSCRRCIPPADAHSWQQMRIVSLWELY